MCYCYVTFIYNCIYVRVFMYICAFVCKKVIFFSALHFCTSWLVHRVAPSDVQTTDPKKKRDLESRIKVRFKSGPL